MPDQPILLLAILALSVLSLLVFTYGSSRAGNGARGGTPVVALTGAPDAGKTTLFSALAFKSLPKTHTSLAPSSARLTVPGTHAPLTLVDLPGHPRMREQTHQALQDPALRGVIFIVDVAALIRNASLVTAELIPVLTTLCARALSHPSAAPPRLLILGNKSDLVVVAKQPTPSTETSTTTTTTTTEKARAQAYDRLVTLLTRDLSRAKSSRATSTGRIDSIDRIPTTTTSASTTSTNPLSLLKRFLGFPASSHTRSDDPHAIERAEEALWGSPGGGGDAGFQFKDIEGVEVTLGVASAARGREGLDEVWEWLEGL